MKEKKSCNNCKYLHRFIDDDGTDKRHCTNKDYLWARNSFKPTGRALCYCTWYEKMEINE